MSVIEQINNELRAAGYKFAPVRRRRPATLSEKSIFPDPDSLLGVEAYINDGFVKVCDVRMDSHNHWFYVNINEKVMFDGHKSWVYFILVDDCIYKVGETGNPLGIRVRNSDQPKACSSNRFGRYRCGDGTDLFVRSELQYEVIDQRVSLWARRCDIVSAPVVVGGETKAAITSFQKDLELHYLDHIFSKTGRYPPLNKGRK